MRRSSNVNARFLDILQQAIPEQVQSISPIEAGIVSKVVRGIGRKGGLKVGRKLRKSMCNVLEIEGVALTFKH